jgi:hypothetical protein
MSDEQTFVAYGATVRLCAGDSRLLAAMRDRLPPSARSSSRADAQAYVLAATPLGYRLSLGGERVFETASLDDALDALQADVEAHISESSPWRMFVHAAVVADGGRALLLPGRSYSGKSTLTAALVRAGAIYYSDEFAVLDARGRVHPYPRAIVLRDGFGARAATPPGALGGKTGAAPLAIGTVAVLRFDPRAARCRLERLSTGAGVLELLANTVVARREPDRALRVLSRAVQSGTTFFAGVRGEADATATELLALIRGAEGAAYGI